MQSYYCIFLNKKLLSWVVNNMTLESFIKYTRIDKHNKIKIKYL